MGRTKPSDILAALDRIYTHKERKDKSEQDMALSLMHLDAQKDAREDQQNFRRETMMMQTKLQYQAQYPGVEFKDDGYTPDFESYDMAGSTASRVADLTATKDQLRLWGVDADGTSDEIFERHTTYLKAKSKGQHIMTPFVTHGAAVAAGYDASQGYLTTKDIVDFEDQFYGAGGVDSPIAIQQLIDAGIISTKNLKLVDGFWSAPDQKSKDLIMTSFQGLKDGVQANRHFKTTEQYEEKLKQNRVDAALYAENMTGHPGVVVATTQMDEAAKSVGASYIGYNYDPQNEVATVLWRGQTIAIEDLPGEINSLGTLSPGEKTKLTQYYEVLVGIGADGSNIAPALDAIGADASLLKIVGKVDIGLATTLKKALRKYKDLNKIQRYVGNFINEPQDVRTTTEFRGYIKDSGLSQKLQQYRTMEVEKEDVTKLGKEIDAIVDGIKLQIQKGYDPKTGSNSEKRQMEKMLKDFYNWMELEEATSVLYKESAQRRRKV